jgi:hypothetical protein
MSRKAKGKRPGYFNDSECDKLLPSLRGRAASRPVTVEHDRRSRGYYRHSVLCAGPSAGATDAASGRACLSWRADSMLRWWRPCQRNTSRLGCGGRPVGETNRSDRRFAGLP